MHLRVSCRVLCIGVVAICASAQALIIQFDYSHDINGFFADPQRRAVLETAADGFRGFEDSLLAITPGGLNTWDAIFTHPGTGGQASVTDLHVPEDTLIIYAGGMPMGGSTLGFGGPGGFSISGFPDFIDTIRSRGQGETQGPAAEDFGPWGGSLTFNSNATWHFGLTTEGLSGKNDFLSVALHELGHLLGVGTADSWDNNVAGLSFLGANSVAANGGPVPLDGDLAHWASGTMSTVNGVAQEANMDPGILVGTRKLFTDLDFAALADIGWEVPEPAEPTLLPGDANRDGRVDGEDFLIWQAAFGTQAGATWDDGDFNGDGRVDGEDFLIWQAHFGSVADSSTITPEPALLAPLLTLLMPVICRRRRAVRGNKG